MNPEKAKAPAIRTRKGFLVNQSKGIKGFGMKNTATTNLTQVCDVMHLYLKAHCGVFTDNIGAFPSDRGDAICRLGRALWAEIAAAKLEAEATARGKPPATPFDRAKEDDGFQRAMAKLTKKPRKNSKLAASLAKEVAH